MTQAPLRDLLIERMPPLFWFRDFHTYSASVITFVGYVCVRDASDRDRVRVHVDQRDVTTAVTWGPPVAKTPFNFLPTECVRTFELRVEVESSRVPVGLNFSLGAPDPVRGDETSLWHFLEGTGSRFPVPELHRIERVSGKGATAYNYVNNGYSDFRRFRSVANRHGVALDNGARILDWGSGCARLTRHFLELAGGVGRIEGVDIDPDNVAWCQRELSNTSFGTVPLYPPTALATDAYDLVLANSVLSHLDSDALDQWLREVRRILKPTGLALLTYHGDFSICGVQAQSEVMVRKIIADGINFERRGAELDAVIGNDTYYRQTFMTDAHARAQFARYFEVVETLNGFASRYQNLAVLRRR